MSLTLPVTLTQGTTANAPDVMADLNAIVNYINTTLAAAITAATFPSGTEMLFLQAAAPTGWTQDATINDRVLRVVSGAGAGTGGSWTISGLTSTVTIAGHTLAVTEIPSHTHVYNVAVNTNNSIGQIGTGSSQVGTSPSNTDGGTGGGGSHGHPGSTATVSSDASWRPNYVNVIACTKN